MPVSHLVKDLKIKKCTEALRFNHFYCFIKDISQVGIVEVHGTALLCAKAPPVVVANICFWTISANASEKET